MRGSVPVQPSMLVAMDMEARIPKDHPLRPIKALADKVLKRMSPVFDAMYSELGRPSTPPEQLLKATLLMAFYTVRSERQFAEQLDYNLLFRWFLDMAFDGPGIDHSTFSRNRRRLLAHEVAEHFFAEVVEVARSKNLLSSDHFSVDGSLIESWASLKSFRPKSEPRDGDPPGDGPNTPPDDAPKAGKAPKNETVDFHGERRSNETHESTTDPEARLARKSNGTTAKLCYTGHALMENKNGLLMDVRLTTACGTAERNTAIEMLNDAVPGRRRITVAADRGYDTKDFVRQCRELNVSPHVAQNTNRKGGSAIDKRTTRHPGYAKSLKFRKRIEEFFGWMKTVGGLRKSRLIGKAKTGFLTKMVGAAYNLLRIARLSAATP